MDIPWDDVRLFLAIAEARSLSGAARKLRLGQPTVTRRLALLEHELGARLFHRSVEGARLTAAGERLVAPAKKMAEWAGEVARASEKRGSAPGGLVRVTAPPYVAWDFLTPLAAALAQKHPGLRLEILSTMEYLDLARGEADLALRTRAPDQEDLKAVFTLTSTNAVFAARALVRRLPRRPRLADLPWISWAPPYDQLPPAPQLRAAIPGFVPAFTSDNILLNLRAAEAGLGVIVLPRRRHRFSPPTTLVPLPLELGPHQRGDLHLVCARSALDIPRVRLVAQFIEAELWRSREI